MSIVKLIANQRNAHPASGHFTRISGKRWGWDGATNPLCRFQGHSSSPTRVPDGSNSKGQVQVSKFLQVEGKSQPWRW